MRKSPPTGERGGASAAPLLCPLLSSTPLLHSHTHIDTRTIILFQSYFKFVHVCVCLLLYSWILWWFSVLCLTELTKLTTYLLQLLLKRQTQKHKKHIGYRTDLQNRFTRQVCDLTLRDSTRLSRWRARLLQPCLVSSSWLCSSVSPCWIWFSSSSARENPARNSHTMPWTWTQHLKWDWF